MPSPRQRRKQIRQSRTARKKRNQWLSITDIQAQHKRGTRELYAAIKKYPHPDKRDIGLISEFHQHDLFDTIRQMAREHPNEIIRVLDDGSGKSTFKSDVQNLADLFKIPVDVTSTDIRPLERGHANVTPEEIISKYGKNRFHLIVSTFGGFNYTHIPKRHALTNFIHALRPGGIASLAIMSNQIQTVYSEIKAVKKRFPAVRLGYYPHPKHPDVYVVTIAKPPNPKK